MYMMKSFIIFPNVQTFISYVDQLKQFNTNTIFTSIIFLSLLPKMSTDPLDHNTVHFSISLHQNMKNELLQTGWCWWSRWMLFVLFKLSKKKECWQSSIQPRLEWCSTYLCYQNQFTSWQNRSEPILKF